MVVTDEFADLLGYSRHECGLKQNLFSFFVVCERLYDLLVIETHILSEEVESGLSKLFISDFIKGFDEIGEKFVILFNVVFGEFDAFALNELFMHSLDLLHMSTLELVVIFQVFLYFLGSIHQFKVEDR